MSNAATAAAVDHDELLSLDGRDLKKGPLTASAPVVLREQCPL